MHHLVTSCGPLQLDNGYPTSYSSHTRAIGSVVYWACQTGYSAQGDTTLTCQQNGTGASWMWANVEPYCLGTCLIDALQYFMLSTNQPLLVDLGPVIQNFSLSVPNVTDAMRSELLNGTGNDQMATLSAIQGGLAYLLAQLTRDQRTLLGYSLQDMTANCRFNEQTCEKQ